MGENFNLDDLEKETDEQLAAHLPDEAPNLIDEDDDVEILDGAPASVGYADGVAALALAEAAMQSSRSGEPVAV